MCIFLMPGADELGQRKFHGFVYALCPEKLLAAGMASSIMNTPFAQQALARTGVDADDCSAEKVSAMAGRV